LQDLTVVGEGDPMAEAERVEPEGERTTERLRGEGRADAQVVL
jgi:hypothetical protein